MLVVYYQRHPQQDQFSLERMFSDVRRSLPKTVKSKIYVARFVSRGFFRRLFNIFEAIFHQGDVNHITGDIHYLALLLKKKKTILTIPDLVNIHRLKGLRRKIFLLLWYRLPIRRVSIVTVISESTKNELLRHVDVRPEKIQVVPCSLSSNFTYHPKYFNVDKPTILQIGTAENKNLRRSFQALIGLSCHLRIIGRISPEIILLLNGGGVEYSNLIDLTDSQIIQEYIKCDIVLFASTYEGFGLPIIEAQAIGRAVITSSVASMVEVAGIGACMVDPLSIDDIRRGVKRVIKDEKYRNTLIEAGFKNTSKFNADVIALKYLNLYKMLVG